MKKVLFIHLGDGKYYLDGPERCIPGIMGKIVNTYYITNEQRQIPVAYDLLKDIEGKLPFEIKWPISL